MIYLYLLACAFFSVVYVAAEWETLTKLDGEDALASFEKEDFKLRATCLLVMFPFTGTYVMGSLLVEFVMKRAGDLIILLCKKVLKVAKR